MSFPIVQAPGPPVPTTRTHHESGSRIEITGFVGLVWVGRATDEGIELNRSLGELRFHPRGRDKHPGGPRRAERSGIAGGEVSAIHVFKLGPPQVFFASGAETLSEHRYRSLPLVVEMRERPSRRLFSPSSADIQTHVPQTLVRAVADRIVSERGEEDCVSR